MNEKSKNEKKSNSAERMKKALKYSSTMPMGTGEATTGAWLMDKSTHGHNHGPNCGCNHAHGGGDDEDEGDDNH